MTKIGVIMLTLNEEARLENALKQFKPHVDYILVVDGGSTDCTVAIARQYADKIIVDTDDNIGAIKNRARLKVPKTCNWLLWADADEKWDPTLLRNMRKILKDARGARGIMRIPRINLPDAKNYPDWQVRIFPNSRDIEWRGKHHEVPWIMNVYPEDRRLDKTNLDEDRKAGLPIMPIFNAWDWPMIHLPRRKDIKRPWW